MPELDAIPTEARQRLEEIGQPPVHLIVQSQHRLHSKRSRETLYIPQVREQRTWAAADRFETD